MCHMTGVAGVGLIPPVAVAPITVVAAPITITPVATIPAVAPVIATATIVPVAPVPVSATVTPVPVVAAPTAAIPAIIPITVASITPVVAATTPAAGVFLNVNQLAGDAGVPQVIKHRLRQPLGQLHQGEVRTDGDATKVFVGQAALVCQGTDDGARAHMLPLATANR